MVISPPLLLRCSPWAALAEDGRYLNSVYASIKGLVVKVIEVSSELLSPHHRL